MLTALIELSLANRVLVIVLVLLIAAGGLYSAATLPIDAVPDMTNVQVQVITDGGSMSPLEVERYLTYPVEAAMNGLADVEELRSVSKFGISVVTVVFGEGVDIYRARQLVNERLVEANSRIAAGRGDPKLGALSTALGEVLQFEVRGDGYTPMELRSILEWDIAPQLRRVAGVTDVNSHGGLYKSYEVAVDPERLASSGFSLEEIVEALERNNASSGGGYIVHFGEQQFLRGEALLKSVKDIEDVVVRSQLDSVPILIKDLCDVQIAPLTRQGLVTRDGRGEVVTGMVMMLLGENSRTVVQAAKERIEEIQGTLPAGVTIEVIYDRADLINRTLHTVLSNLVEGGVLVIVVLLVLLGSIRAGLIVALAIPLSMLFAANLMQATGITASLMSLGAIDFGLIVDSSVIMIENCMRRLGHRQPEHAVADVVRDAAVEVRKPTMFGELIIAVVYLPILTLEGTEGKLFRPMAWTVLFALAGSLVLSLTLMPVLASFLLPANTTEKDVLLLRLVKRIYRPCLAFAVDRPVLVSFVAIGLLLGSLPIAARLGAEFMPRLDEGDLLIEANRLPSATLEDAVTMSDRVEHMLLEFPEVKTVFCKTGRPEIANDVMGVQQTDIWVMLRPTSEWPEQKSREMLIEEMSAQLDQQVPGVNFGFTQPIEMRVDELVAGVKADVAVLLYGDDLQLLARKGKEIESVLAKIPGAADVKADYQANITSLTIRAKPEQLARHGITAAAVMDTVAALGGVPVGEVFEGRAYYPIVVRVPQNWREEQSRLERIPITSPGGVPIPLGELADIELEESPPGIEHEATRRRTFVSANVRGRDVASFVNEARSRVTSSVKLPPGYTLQWGGDFENLQSASLRLAIITPIVLLMIFLLLYTTFKSASLAVLIFLAVPMAASGGVAALALREMPFSISAGVGFIALFGVAVLNGLVWVSSAESMRLTGVPLREAAFETGLVRIRPVLMTAMVASLGFLPMALSTSAGAEIQRPLASVVIGGLVTSTLLTALVIPAIYPWFCPRQSL
ncbi:MAG: CusA/CzcA family heavy metal efflux RND transporter [Planctomycetia bacterium]|nr:CusA/CzcA family heavy metal efflux RND transporter [Planctomycetia bacterium]